MELRSTRYIHGQGVYHTDSKLKTYGLACMVVVAGLAANLAFVGPDMTGRVLHGGSNIAPTGGVAVGTASELLAVEELSAADDSTPLKVSSEQPKDTHTEPQPAKRPASLQSPVSALQKSVPAPTLSSAVADTSNDSDAKKSKNDKKSKKKKSNSRYRN